MKDPNRLLRKVWQGACAAALLVTGTAALAQVNVLNGIVAHWSFDDDSFADGVGIFDGEGQGSEAIPFVQGKDGFGKAIHLNGEDQYVLITGGEPDDLSFQGVSMSVSAWFTVDAFDTDWQALVAKGEGGNWRIHRRGSESVMGFTGGAAGDTPSGPTAVNDGQWHHLVAVNNTDEGTAYLYIDGKLEAQLANSAPEANGLQMRIGDNPGATGREWEGMIDDVTLWNRAINADEVAEIYANGAGRSIASFRGVQIEVLGVGAEFLLGGDLTDPENDGVDALGAATDPSWNWAAITSSHEPDFEGGENSFNIFDNKVGGGNDKWCCDDPTAANPVWVTVEFPQPVGLTHFTLTSGNDTPDRDPTDWAIQGSSDGANFTDIYHWTGTPVPWTERNQVVKFTLPSGAPPYRFIRYIAYATPAPLHQLNEIEYFGNVGSSTVAFLSNIRNTITSFGFNVNDEGTSVVDPATVKLVLDGANIDLGTLTKTDGVISVLYEPPSVFLPSSVHDYSITATDNFGNVISSTGSFTTRAYALLTAADTVTPDTSKAGFVWRVHLNTAFQANDNVRPLQQLRGELGDNFADAWAQGIALDAPAVIESPGGDPANPGRLPVRFEIGTVINMSQAEGDANGEFSPDDQMPGVPGLDGSTDGIAGEITTYIELPAGLHTFIVNSDDGFETRAGNVRDVFRSQVAGFFSGGRGAADTAYTLFVQDAGVYPFRTVWEEGGGGANIEWKTEKEDGSRVLINDTANGGFRAYRAVTSAPLTAVTSVSPAINSPETAPDANIRVVISEGAQAVDQASIQLSVNNVAVTPTVTKTGSEITVTYDPPSDFSANSQNTATLTFTAGGSSRTDSWSFRVPPITRDLVDGHIGNILGTAWFTADAGGRTGQAGDYGMDFAGRAGNTVHVPDVSFLNSATGAGQLTFSHWQKLAAVQNSSAFWVNSPASNNGTRGWQAHVPWGDNSIYFDTSGCCVADETRINVALADVITDYTPAFWNAWHHLAFVRKTDGLKEIYLDGNLIWNGSSLPLMSDWTDMYIGAQNTTANTINGVIDDLAIFRTALSDAQIKSLAAGTAPGAVTGNPGLLAHWDFNDVPADAPTLSVVRNANGTITVTFDGVLETATSVQGPYTVQAGTSPITLTPDQNQVFARSRQ